MEPRKTGGWCFSHTISSPSIGNELHTWIPNNRATERTTGSASSFARMPPSHETPSVASPRQGVVVTDCDSNDSYRLHGDSQFVNTFIVKQSAHVDNCASVTTSPERRRQRDMRKPSDPIEQQGPPKQYSVEVRVMLIRASLKNHYSRPLSMRPDTRKSPSCLSQPAQFTNLSS